MVARSKIVVVILAALSSLGASHRTKNFVVEAATPQIAERSGQWAEYYRKQKAELWLGKEMPTWGVPCPLRVTVTYGGSGGATEFAFDKGSILSINMRIEGTLERLVASVLPHEVTHTVFAYHFRQPVPRWADEGGSVLSEDDTERGRHDKLVRDILNSQRRAIPLRRLFALTQYPDDVMVLYAEGYSVTNFLVARSNRAAFLNFIADGLRQGWDRAAQSHYGFSNVEDLERAWVRSLSQPRPADTTLASGTARAETTSTTASRPTTRQTLVPILGVPRPVVRGISPSPDDGTTRRSPSSWSATPSPAPPSGSPIPMPPSGTLGVPRPSTGY
jgi:hypothetical protein